MKKIITESLIKGAFFSIGATFTILGVYAATNLISVQSVNNQTVLTSNLWNETMSSLTGAINELKTNSVNLDGDQTISGSKTFSTPVAGVTPTDSSHLATKIYVDSKVGATSSNITGGQSCPTTISDISKNSDTISNAVKVCRDMGNGYRLPSFEELSCFINTPLTGTNTNLLTRTSYGANYLSILLSSGYVETVPYGTAKYYRCVK